MNEIVIFLFQFHALYKKKQNIVVAIINMKLEIALKQLQSHQMQFLCI